MRRLLCVLTAVVCLIAAKSVSLAAAELPSLLLTREVSCTYAEVGDWVTLSYMMSNTTEYPITQLTLTDSLLGEVAHIDRLEPGEKKVVTIRARITGNCESVPVAKYTLGGKSRTRYLLALPIRIERPAYSAYLEQDEEVLRLTVTNEGNGPLSAIRASEPSLGGMGETVSVLESGETAVFERAARSGRYMCTVTAVTAAGKNVTFTSNEVEVVEIPTVRAATDGLSLTARQERSGQIVLTLINPGPDTLRGVRLTELNSGAGRTLDFVPVGEGTQVLWTDTPPGQAVFVFQADWEGESLRAELTARAPTASGGRGVSGGLTPSDGASYRMTENPQTYRQMLILTILALAVVIFVWYAAAKRRRYLEKKRRQKLKQDRQKRKGQIRKSGERAA